MLIQRSRAGVDHAREDDQAPAMANISYLLASPVLGEAWLVDPAWDVPGLLRQIADLGCRATRVLLTHTHADHCGGFIFGVQIPGLDDLEKILGLSVPVSVHPAEREGLLKTFPELEKVVEPLDEAVPLRLGDETVDWIHAPGHSPGSVCYRADGCIFTGDVLFARGCGRVDLPGGDPRAMVASLRLLRDEDPELRLCPGHSYGKTDGATLGGALAALGELPFS